MPDRARADAPAKTAALAIPVGLNLAIGAAVIAADLGCLWVASRASHWAVLAAAVLGFAAANNTVFCLLHESVHGSFHPSRRVNDLAGVVLAAFFPTSLTIQRVSHFGHHRRNRTDLELYDYYLPHQSRWLKTYWIYCLLTGFYWAIIPVAVAVYLVCPVVFRTRFFRHGPARLWGFEEFVRDIAEQPIGRVWPEVLFTALVQVSIWTLLGLGVARGLACYWAFGIVWSSVQYVDHAWSPRDVYEGAWNLRVGPLFQAVFLNYNFHLAHHRRPDVPWIHLPRQVKPDDPAPSFSSIYWPLWRGAAPAPPGEGPAPLPPSAFRPSRARP